MLEAGAPPSTRVHGTVLESSAAMARRNCSRMHPNLREILAAFVLVHCLGGNLLPQLRPETTTQKPATKKTKKKASQKTEAETPKTTPAQIVVHTSPEAEVYLDDQFEGRAGTEGRVVIANPVPGTHKLRVSQTGKRSYEGQVAVTAAQSTEIIAALAELPGELRIHTAPGAQVFVDDVNRGSANAEGQLDLSDLAPGTHNFRIVAPGKQDWDSKIEVAAGKTSEVTAALAPNAQGHFSAGNALLAKHDVDGAIVEYREALRLKPDYPEAHATLAFALSGKRDLDSAIGEYREALRLKPDFAVAHNNLGGVLGKKGDWDGALTEFREAIRLQPNYALAHRNVGWALRNKGDMDGAIAEYREAARLKPDDAAAHEGLGALLGQKGELDPGIVELREAIRLQPDFVAAHNNLGWALGKKGDWGQDIAEQNEAIRLGAKDAWTHFQLGLALEMKGDRSPALEQYRLASQIDPSNSSFRNAYERLLAPPSRNEGASALRPATAADIEDFSLGHWHGGPSLCWGKMTVGGGFVRYRSSDKNGHSFDFPLSSIAEVKENHGLFSIRGDFHIRLKDGKVHNFSSNDNSSRSAVLEAIHRAMTNR